jgi:signal transduction histidine kinase/CheY-like chemotaxis protein
MRLRSHYVLLAISIVLPVVVFCGIALTMLQDAQHDSAIKRIEESASQTAHVVDADIHRAQSVLRVLANSHALATGDMRAFHEEARQASATPGGWIILYDVAGQQLINTRRPFGDSLPMRPDPESVTRMLASGQGQVSNMRWGSVLKNLFVMAETPILAADGKRYVIGQAFSPEYFAHTFAGRAIPPSWRVAILDRDGAIIARSARAGDFVGKRVRPATQVVINQSRTGVLKHLSGDNTEVYDAYTRSSLSNWSIIVGAPVSEINAAVWKSVSVIAAGLIIALLAALTLAVFAGRHLLRFVEGASEAAAALGRGDQLGATSESGIYELEGLNEAMREASARLQGEIASRALAESERNALLVLEQNARARAEEQNAAKDEFLAMLGHELRNPLSAVASAVAILDRSPDDATAAKAREVLRRQTNQLRKMVDDLLEVNRALMGKLTLETAPLDLAEIVRRCLDTLHASGRTARFTVQLATVPSVVNADPARLMQVIDNILDNAIKYSPDGGLLQVDLRHVDDDVELCVRDTGQGISAQLLPTVFDIFVQGSQPLQRASGGLGIGLSLVRRLVEMHGGVVKIDSAGAGQGATVTVRLPRVAAAELAADGVAPQPEERRRRVMLVEDNDDAREMMAMLLELHACDVVAAASGPDGIALAQQQAPEVAFIDIGLPGMDGYAVARALKGDPRTAHIELIALTGYGSARDRSMASEAGFTHHFTKPIKLEDLQLALG